MKRLMTICAIVLALTLTASAADRYGEPAQPNGAPTRLETLWGEEEQGSGANSARQGGVSGVDFATTSYPTSVTRSEDGGEIRKIYDLGPEEDPAGIPRSDFEQEGFRYTLVDLLRQELPEHESRRHTETVSLESKSKDMAFVLALLPSEREFVTEDGLAGTLALQLDTVNVEVSGYGSATKELTATRTYPGLADQDTQYIPKSIQDSGHTLTLQTVDWQTQGDGHFTAVASYTGSAASSYVKGYTVTAEYVGTVSRINLNKVRYVAIFEGTPVQPPLPVVDTDSTPAFRLAWLLVPLGIVALAGAGVGVALFIKRRNEEAGA